MGFATRSSPTSLGTTSLHGSRSNPAPRPLPLAPTRLGGTSFSLGWVAGKHAKCFMKRPLRSNKVYVPPARALTCPLRVRGHATNQIECAPPAVGHRQRHGRVPQLPMDSALNAVATPVRKRNAMRPDGHGLANAGLGPDDGYHGVPQRHTPSHVLSRHSPRRNLEGLHPTHPTHAYIPYICWYDPALRRCDISCDRRETHLRMVPGAIAPSALEGIVLAWPDKTATRSLHGCGLRSTAMHLIFD